MWGYWTLGVDRGIPGVPPEPCHVRSEHRLLPCLLLPTLGGAGGSTERHRDGPCWEHIPYTVGPLRELIGQEGESPLSTREPMPHMLLPGAPMRHRCCVVLYGGWQLPTAHPAGGSTPGEQRPQGSVSGLPGHGVLQLCGGLMESIYDQ